jgi:GntR family transcriptional regulator, trigonelline degradation regulator
MQISREAAPIRQQTVVNLRNAISEGHFTGGERLIERKLCELIGVSRTSIREALRQLEAEGLIKVIPNKGPVVATVTPEEARDIYQVRAMMESLACRDFAERASTSQIEALVGMLKHFEKVAAQTDGKELVKAKNDFYTILLDGCGNKLVKSFLLSLHARISLLRSISMSQPGRALHTLKEINAIVRAIEQRDPQAAWESSVIHVRNAEAVALEVLAKLQEDL